MNHIDDPFIGMDDGEVQVVAEDFDLFLYYVGNKDVLGDGT